MNEESKVMIGLLIGITVLLGLALYLFPKAIILGINIGEKL